VRVWRVYPNGRPTDVVRLESAVHAILVEGGRAVGVRVNGEEMEALAVIITAPVHSLALEGKTEVMADIGCTVGGATC
jgi:L-2-hydroxyglutarate oxidase LhgO